MFRIITHLLHLQVAETITGSSIGATATAGTVTFGDIDNHFIPINDRIIGVVNIFDIHDAAGGQTSSNMFNFRYQFNLNEMPFLTGGSIAHYQMTQSHLQLMQDIYLLVKSPYDLIDIKIVYILT